MTLNAACERIRRRSAYARPGRRAELDRLLATTADVTLPGGGWSAHLHDHPDPPRGRGHLLGSATASSTGGRSRRPTTTRRPSPAGAPRGRLASLFLDDETRPAPRRPVADPDDGGAAAACLHRIDRRTAAIRPMRRVRSSTGRGSPWTGDHARTLLGTPTLMKALFGQERRTEFGRTIPFTEPSIEPYVSCARRRRLPGLHLRIELEARRMVDLEAFEFVGYDASGTRGSRSGSVSMHTICATSSPTCGTLGATTSASRGSSSAPPAVRSWFLEQAASYEGTDVRAQSRGCARVRDDGVGARHGGGSRSPPGGGA
jgi:hypothetical protein